MNLKAIRNVKSIPAEDILNQARKVLDVEAQCIIAAKQHLNTSFVQAVHHIAKSIAQNGKVVVTGVGKSGKIASKIAATLASTGTPSLYLHPTEGAHGDLGIVSNKDVLLALSYSGNSDEILYILPRIKELGVPIVSILGKLQSPLASMSDVVIDGSVAQEACPLNLAPTSSTTVALALGDALAMTLSMLFQFKEEDFAENHPSGALGRRLKLKVQDLMKKGDELPWVEAEASMDTVVEISSQKKLGAVLVKDGNAIGIITDGDIRRSLKHREKFFHFKAKDIMTKNPISILETEKAIDALELMENRASQISILPVINDAKKCIGLVRLHDLIGRL